MDNSKTNRTRKVAFASVMITMDFRTMVDAMRYRAANRGKGWLFMEPYLNDSSNGFVVSMIVKKPYKNYNPGW